MREIADQIFMKLKRRKRGTAFCLVSDGRRHSNAHVLFQHSSGGPKIRVIMPVGKTGSHIPPGEQPLKSTLPKACPLVYVQDRMHQRRQIDRTNKQIAKPGKGAKKETHHIGCVCHGQASTPANPPALFERSSPLGAP